MKIWHVPGSRSLRVVWLCEEMGVPYELRPVSLRAPDPELQAVSPFGGVPVLEDGGVRMIESIAMLLYIAGRYGPTPLALQPDDPAYPDYLQWLILGEASFAMPGNMLIYDRWRAPEGHQPGGFLAQVSVGKMERAVGLMAETLKDRPYLAGDRFTLADISASYPLGVMETFLDLGEAIPAPVADYHRRLTERPAYQRAAAV